jgi:hypothetical protein
MPAPEVMPIFATPFGVATLEDAAALNPPLAALLGARASPQWRDPALPAAIGCFRSRDDLCEWPDAPLRQALAGILAAVSAVAASINDLSAEQFAALRREARASFSLVASDGCVPPLSYPNCSWLALYCVTAPEPSATRFDSGVLRLLEWRAGSSFQDASHGGLRLPYRPSHCTWRPVPGQLAVFPAWVSHEIAPVRAAGVLTLITVRVRFVASDNAWMPPW